MSDTLRPSPTAAVRRRLAVTLSVAGGAVAAAVSGACGEGAVRLSQSTFDLGVEAKKAITWKETPQEPISLELSAPSTIARGSEAPIRVRVRNGGSRPIAVGFGQQRGFNVMVARAEGPADSAAIWSLPAMFNPARDVTVMDPLRPGRDTVFSVVWPGTDDGGRPVTPGAYRLRATLSAELISTRQIWTEWKPITVVEK